MRVDKSWGWEEVLTNGDYCCKKLVYTRPTYSSMHYHNDKHETFVVATGRFIIESGTTEKLNPRTAVPGFSIVLPPKTVHRITCLEPGFIVEASTHDRPEDCVRIVPSEA